MLLEKEGTDRVLMINIERQVVMARISGFNSMIFRGCGRLSPKLLRVKHP